jgi:hypothetical protein
MPLSVYHSSLTDSRPTKITGTFCTDYKVFIFELRMAKQGSTIACHSQQRYWSNPEIGRLAVRQRRGSEARGNHDRLVEFQVRLSRLKILEAEEAQNGAPYALLGGGHRDRSPNGATRPLVDAQITGLWGSIEGKSPNKSNR